MIEKLVAAIIALFMGVSSPVLPPGKTGVSPPITPPPTVIATKSIFVPSWTITSPILDESYDAYYYFGLTPDGEGNIVHDAGYEKANLLDSIPEKKKYMVLRMLDRNSIETYVSDTKKQSELITTIRAELVSLHAQGIVLDLELSFTTLPERSKQITALVQQLCTGLHKDYKSCFVAIYGDSFYRSRPYDVKKIGESADRILVMAYDFHKAGGEPGPNFPLSRRSLGEGGSFNYGYDFRQMIKDYTSEVSVDKLEIVFGMYGYDWTMNEQGTPLKSAQALTLRQIESQITDRVAHNVERYKLHVTRNSAGEKKVDYIDEEGRRHVIWYEDEESVNMKIDYLRSQGIGHISYWAYGYW